MKKLIMALSLISSMSAYSATVKILSFTSIQIENSLSHPLAELCGKVEGATKIPSFVKVVVDAGSRRPATYNTVADEMGNFCLTLTTHRGRAEASVFGESQSVTAKLIP
jgi:hypothetical protein